MPCRCATSCATAPTLLAPVPGDNSRNTSQPARRREIGGGPGGATRLYADIRSGPSGSGSVELHPAAVVEAVQPARRATGQPSSRDGVADRRAVTRPRRRPRRGDLGERVGTAATDARGHLLAVSPPGTTSKSPPRKARTPRGQRGVLLVGQPCGRRGSTHAAGRRGPARGRSPWRRTPPCPAPGRCRRTRARSAERGEHGATAAACRCPSSSSSDVGWPCTRRCAFQAVWPCRSRTSRRGSVMRRRRPAARSSGSRATAARARRTRAPPRAGRARRSRRSR